MSRFGGGQDRGEPRQTLAQSAVHAVAVGEDDTARLYDKYARQLYRYCLARLRSPEEAEDAVQNTFIRVHGALAKGTTPRFEAAWLYKIAHNVCLTRIETRSRRAEHELSSDFDELDVAAPESEREALIGLEAALASMPKNLRDAILLREWQGLSYAEIAESLDTSVPAVETLIFRARRHLAAALQPAGAAGLDAGTLYGAVRVLLARLRALGSGKLAVGVAAATLGTAGVTAAVTDLEAHPPGHDRAPVATVRGAVPAAALTRPGTAAPHAAPAAATATTHAAPRRRAPRPFRPAAVAAVAAPVVPVATAPVTTAAVSPVPAPPPAPAPTTAQAPSAPPVTTPTPTLSLTPVSTATISTPTLTAPALTTPTIAAPTVTEVVPALPVTVTVAVPTVTAPTLP